MIITAQEAKQHIGKRLYWLDKGPKYAMLRSGILTDVYKGQLEFDDTRDFQPIARFSELTTEVHEEWK